ncbi:Fe2OG dioxygenase domain-containing protein [[Candida] zeylanoides]
MLTESQLAAFERDGCLCIPDFLAPAQTDALLERSHHLLRQLDLQTHPKTQFKTGENDHIGDNYFFNSADKVSYFFDTDAFDADGRLQFPAEQAINKIGHGLHMHDAVFRDVTLSDRVRAIARALRYEDPRVLQSMCILKQPATGAAERDNMVPVHADGTFLYTQPHSALGFWFALEDCTVDNGCLWYSPGSHKSHPITKRFVKVDGGDSGCAFAPVDAPPPDGPEADYTSIECRAGSLVLIHNGVLHKSHRNRSHRSRFIYAFHLIEGTATYDRLNWLQVPPCREGGTDFTRLYQPQIAHAP